MILSQYFESLCKAMQRKSEGLSMCVKLLTRYGLVSVLVGIPEKGGEGLWLRVCRERTAGSKGVTGSSGLTNLLIRDPPGSVSVGRL